MRKVSLGWCDGWRRETRLGRGCLRWTAGTIIENDDLFDLADNMPDHHLVDVLLHQPEEVGVVLVDRDERVRVTTFRGGHGSVVDAERWGAEGEKERKGIGESRGDVEIGG